jgi:hypothetical protein
MMRVEKCLSPRGNLDRTEEVAGFPVRSRLELAASVSCSGTRTLGAQGEGVSEESECANDEGARNSRGQTEEHGRHRDQQPFAQ